MRQIRTNRLGLNAHGNKENQYQEMNFSLKNNIPNKHSFNKNQCRINLNHNSKNQGHKSNAKTYLNLGNQKKKKSRIALGLISKNKLSIVTGMNKMTIETQNSQIR